MFSKRTQDTNKATEKNVVLDVRKILTKQSNGLFFKLTQGTNGGTE